MCNTFMIFFIEQVRYPVLLTPAEKQMARQLCIAFRQAVCSESIPVALAELYFFKTVLTIFSFKFQVCGFDLLRYEGCSHVL